MTKTEEVFDHNVVVYDAKGNKIEVGDIVKLKQSFSDFTEGVLYKVINTYEVPYKSQNGAGHTQWLDLEAVNEQNFGVFVYRDYVKITKISGFWVDNIVSKSD